MSVSTSTKPRRKQAKEPKMPWKKDLQRNWLLYLMFLVPGTYYFVFNYLPISGLAMAFQDFNVRRGIWASEWVGLQNFVDLFTGDTFGLVMRNTIAMALLNLTVGFVIPIILAFLICEVRNIGYRRTVQTVSYMPYFVAAVVVASLAKEFFGNSGAITQLLTALGFDQQNWIANSNVPVFWLINTFMNVWQGAGYGAIVYVAAIMSVNTNYYEAAAIDGANRWQRLTRVTFPSILPLIVIMFTLRVGTVFTQGFENILLLYMPSTYETADVLTTYTYRMAFTGSPNYGLSTASGLFQSVVGTVLLFVSNWLNRKVNQTSLF